MITTAEIPEARMRELEREGATCAECRAPLTVAWGGLYGQTWILRCKDIAHTGVYTEAKITPFDVPGFNLYESKRRRDMAETALIQSGATPAAARQMAAYHNAILTQERAIEILKTCFPGAPQLEMTKAAMICHQYELNPLMGHIFLIPFEKKELRNGTWVKTGEKTWAVVLGIKATRLMAAKGKGSWGYLDDTPRVMTEAEQVRFFGQAYPDRFYVIVKIENDAHQKFTGTGWWPKAKEVKGEDKGNTIFNMASIRAERNALEKMAPGRFDGVITMDEAEIAEARAQAGAAGIAVPDEGDVPDAQCEISADEIDWDVPHDPPPAPVIIESEAVEVKPKPGLDTQWVAQAVGIIGWKQQEFYRFLQETYAARWPGYQWPACTQGIWRNIVISMPTALQDDLKARLDGMVRALDSRPGGRNDR